MSTVVYQQPVTRNSLQELIKDAKLVKHAQDADGYERCALANSTLLDELQEELFDRQYAADLDFLSSQECRVLQELVDGVHMTRRNADRMWARHYDALAAFYTHLGTENYKPKDILRAAHLLPETEMRKQRCSS